MTPEDLPEGWRAVRLREVAEVALGKMLDRAKRTRGLALPYLRNASVRWDGFDLSDLTTMPYEDHELERYSVRPGDVFVCEGGEPGRAAMWTGGDATIKYQKALLRVRPGPLLHPRWLIHSLRHDALSGRLEQYFTGSTIKHFPREAALRYELPLPPLSEQRCMIERIDALLVQVNAAREHLTRVRKILKRFRQSVLAAACSGRLTEKWREDAYEGFDSAQQPRGWATRSLGELSERVTKGSTPTSYGHRYQQTGVRFVRVENLRGGRIDIGSIRAYISQEAHEGQARSRLQPGDVLFSIAGTIGTTAVVALEELPANTNQAIAIIRGATKRIQSDYLLAVLDSQLAQAAAASRARGGGMNNISLADVRALAVPVPPHAEQQEIVRRIKALSAVAEAIESRVTGAAACAERIPQAVLAKAFLGELLATAADVARAT